MLATIDIRATTSPVTADPYEQPVPLGQLSLARPEKLHQTADSATRLRETHTGDKKAGYSPPPNIFRPTQAKKPTTNEMTAAIPRPEIRPDPLFDPLVTRPFSSST